MSYQPISCNFYDELEALATLRQIATINYRLGNGQTATAEGKIVNLYTKDKEEFLELDSGFTLRLDYLISVNGKVLAGYC
ncbi:MAG: hypothetical protein AAF798_17490 [Bacteroidota bacterium]